jgi:hypothetical protein
MGNLNLSVVVLLVLILSCLRALMALGSITRGVIAQELAAPIYGSSLEETIKFMSYA